jgi:cation diffusion facilitator CzcD-associated flavoprotein CzcO
MKLPGALARAHLRRQVPDPVLREKLTPSYTIGCKRILISNDFYPALSADNADVVTDPIERMTERGIVTSDGVEHEVDTIVFATGFQVTPPPIASAVTGRGGRLLADVWAEHGMQAHRGTTIAGFPNLFFLVGPNTGLGHTSMVYVIEAQIAYVLSALEEMSRSRLAAIEPTPEAQAAFNAALQERLRGTVWDQGGCASWYLDDTGRNTTLWPWFTFRLRKALSAFDAGAYAKTPA